jgi:hypothetical protein
MSHRRHACAQRKIQIRFLGTLPCASVSCSTHLELKEEALQEFLGTLDLLRESEKAWMAPEGVALHGIGHSNGALLHLLIGSQSRPSNASNVAISFNNK